MFQTTINPLQQGLTQLAHKYALPMPDHCLICDEKPSMTDEGTYLLPGWLLDEQITHPDNCYPLLPWQHERRFIELRNIVQQKTIEQVCMWRSRWLVPTGTMSLQQAIYRELGVCQWVLDSIAVSILATVCQDRAANVIVLLDNDVTCGIEIGMAPAASQVTVDRHEAIARRGVASDQVVDSEVRPSSVYVLSDAGTTTFTDVDDELFGLDESQVSLVRNAFAVLQEPALVAVNRVQHKQLAMLTQLAMRSAQQQCRLDVPGGAV